MQIFTEMLLIMFAGIFTAIAGSYILLYLHGNSDGEIDENRAYMTGKAKFMFLPALIFSGRWKSGLIAKNTLWCVVSVYIYYAVFFLADLIYCLVKSTPLIQTKPVWFVMFSVVPFAVAVIYAIVITIIREVMTRKSKK